MKLLRILVDTNIVSYIMRGGSEAMIYAPYLNGKILSVSFITVGELYFWAEKRHWGEKKRLRLENVLTNYVVIPYDHEIAKCYARVRAERERKGLPISCADAWIAACAVRHGIPLVTHNAKDFDEISNLQMISEDSNCLTSFSS